MLQIRSLAFWLETAKMHSDLTGNLLGGVALADMAAAFTRAQQARANGSQVRG